MPQGSVRAQADASLGDAVAGGASRPAATKGVLTTQPGGAVNGVAFTQQPVVQLRDANDNNVSSANVDVVAAIASGTGTLAGVTTVKTNAGGAATFTDLKLTGTAGSFTLSFTPTALTAATSNSFSLTFLTMKAVPAGTFQRDATPTNTSYVSAFSMSEK